MTISITIAIQLSDCQYYWFSLFSFLPSHIEIALGGLQQTITKNSWKIQNDCVQWFLFWLQVGRYENSGKRRGEWDYIYWTWNYLPTTCPNWLVQRSLCWRTERWDNEVKHPNSFWRTVLMLCDNKWELEDLKQKRHGKGKGLTTSSPITPLLMALLEACTGESMQTGAGKRSLSLGEK